MPNSGVQLTRKERLVVATLFVVLASVPLGMMWYGWTVVRGVLPPDANWHGERVEESQQRGEAIAAALERYRAAHGRYPERLADLVPAYVARVEEPTAGRREWVYDPRPDGSFYRLSFSADSAELDNYPSATYTPDTRKWAIDQ